MYDTATRVRLAQQCARTRRRKREQRKTQGLFVLCTALLGSLLGTLNAVSSPEPPALEGCTAPCCSTKTPEVTYWWA